MTIREICEKLKNFENGSNELVYTTDEKNLKIEVHTLLGFVKKKWEFGRPSEKYVYYAYIDSPSNGNEIIKIEEVYGNEELAKDALNKIIQQKVDSLLSKKL